MTQKELKRLGWPANLLMEVFMEEISPPDDFERSLVYVLFYFSEKEKLILNLRYRECFTFREIGERIGISLAAARQTDEKIIRKLRLPSNYRILRTGVSCLTLEWSLEYKIRRELESEFENKLKSEITSFKENFIKDFWAEGSINLKYLDFSNKTLNHLRNIGITTLEQLACKSNKDISSFYGIGQKVISEIAEKLRALGYDRSDDINEDWDY